MNPEENRSTEYWMALSRMGFEDDLHRLMEEQEMSRSALATAIEATPPYISKLLNGNGGNFTLRTLVKLARALKALVEIRLIADGREVVRVMTIEEARELDDRHEEALGNRNYEEVLAPVVQFPGTAISASPPINVASDVGVARG